jgi:E3 ubiquitin-protein ligase synoviolin
MAKYALGIYELRRAASRGGAQAPPWEAKSMYVFYIELLTGMLSLHALTLHLTLASDFCKLTTYLAFFAIIMTLYGLPLNLIREVYVTGHSFVTRLAAFQRYRAATRDMDERYPNATAEELSGESDHTCIICREEMVVGTAEAGAPPPPTDGPNMTPKKLPCGHIFHFYCLRSWLERQQKCPTWSVHSYSI